MTLNKKLLSATLLGACLSTTTFAQDTEEQLTTPPSEVFGMIVDGTKTAANAVADASVKTYNFVKPYAGAAWDTTKDAAIKSKDFISERINNNSNAEPHVPAPIESYSLSNPQQKQSYPAPSANSSPYATMPSTTYTAPSNNVTTVPVTPPAIEINDGEIVRGSIDPNQNNEQVAVSPKPSAAPARVGQNFVVEDEYTP